MILQALHDLHDRLRDDEDYLIAPSDYSFQKITFKVVLTTGGELYDIQDARFASEGRLRPQLVRVPGEAKPSGSGFNPCFLWDNTGYMLGYKPDDENPERTVNTFKAFRERHLKLESDIGSAAFSSVCRFLEQWDVDRAHEYPVLAEITTGFGVFQFRGETSFIHQNPIVQTWWENHGTEDPVGLEGQCLITGEVAPIARTHPKVKGVRGAQTSGATLVSFNEAAYESYGKTQSFNSPVSAAASVRYVKALNALLDSPMSYKHRISIGDATVLFWTAKPTVTENIFASFILEGSEPIESDDVQDEGIRQKLDGFLRALRKGQEKYAELEEDPERTSFFLLGLSPNAARLSVRFFHHGTLADLLNNLRQHYNDTRIMQRPVRGERRADPEFPSIRILLRQTARESKNIPPIITGPLLRAIITGTRYPDSLYNLVLRRIHADRIINYPRACVIKGYLTRNLNKEVSMSLDTGRTDPAYRLGRLFAALEKTQKDALGQNLNKTIRDSYYSSASSTPQSVFPRLLRTYQHHLGKMEIGLKVYREKLVQEILDPLDEFPAHLNLADQGLFTLGYYQQTQAFYTSNVS